MPHALVIYGLDDRVAFEMEISDEMLSKIIRFDDDDSDGVATYRIEAFIEHLAKKE